MKPLEQKALGDVMLEMGNKAALERSFLPRIRAHLDRIAHSFRQVFSATGLTPNLTVNRERLAHLLAAHYRDVSRLFKDTVLVQLGVFPEGVADLRDRALVQWIDERAPLQAFAIVTTSERQMPDAISRARSTLIAEDSSPTQAAIAATAANLMRINGRSRAPSIASFETQVAAETTKRITAEAAGGRVPFPLAGRDLSAQPIVRPVPIATKQWQTEEDDSVRPSHVTANQQTVPVDEPFIVGGEALSFPGDTSRGASLKNVIGCRCASVYRLGELR